MIYDEGRVKRDGEVLPIECIRIQLTERQPAGSVNLHYHDYTELLFGLSGSASVAIGNSVSVLETGGLTVIQAGDAHVVWSNGCKCSYIVVKFLPEMLISAEQTGAEFGYALTLIEYSEGRQSYFSPDELKGTGIPDILRRMMTEWEEKQFGYELSLRADVTRVILFLLRRWQKSNPELCTGIAPADRRLMQTALAYIGEHYADLSEQDVARACGISTVAVSRLFARSMKNSFPDYVRGVRLREAEKLLLTTDLTITDIALQVGFSTSAYFIARFREARGITPYRFRRLRNGQRQDKENFE